ncbi:MAG TPA: SpoIIE family protein phosphatase [Candidatus Acidoferrales bacterium]|nr:SpoIIE family protein phosphatase [Candidatus Acidoferrales bacterium]
MRVLIVDDEPVNRLVLARKLQQWGHEPVQACDGAQAWAMIQAEPFRMVVTDWMMPEMDGLELTRRIRASPLAGYTYVLLVTARSGVEALVEGIEAGADDFVAKPFQIEELRARIRAGERVLQLESDLAEHNRRLSEANASARRDLEAAAEMQKALLPPPGQELAQLGAAWRFLPASLVAGDVFNVHALDEHRSSFYLLDVAGHGVPSAMLSFTLSKLLAPTQAVDGLVKRPLGDAPGGEITPPADVLRELNRRFQDDSSALKYFTMVYGIVDTARDVVTIAQAGHPTPLLLRPSGEVVRLGDSGFPVGMLPNVEFEQHEHAFLPGDRLFLYSDGVTECAGSARVIYGLSRLESFLASQAGTSVGQAVGELELDLRRWRESAEFADDVTVFALERRAA